MATPNFSTRKDDLRFRRITWLLSLLGSKRKADDDTSHKHPKNNIKPLLGELTWLANLLVRHHEVVAVMPHRSGLSPDTNEHQSKGIEGTCYITRNPRRQVPTHGSQIDSVFSH